MANLSAIKLPNGETYNLVDKTSGYITTSIYFGTCASAAADTTKVVACADFTELKAGAAILVTFSATNSAAVADLMMNVNGTGAKKIQYINNGTRGNLSSADYLKASTTYLFVYDGTYWVVYLNYNTTYSSMTDAEITAGTGTTARTITPARLKTAVETWAPEETDPVFSASAAAGITSTDISNWNGKSNTDEKVKQESLNGDNSSKNLLFTNGLQSTNTVTTSIAYGRYITYNDYAQTLYITNSDSTQQGSINYNQFGFKKGSYYIYINAPSTLTTHQSIYIPNKSGTIALTSDIPKVYSSTNTGGYLTMATLPIYDGTVV